MKEIKLYGKEKLLDDLGEVGNRLNKRVSIYLIGGCAMSLKDLKRATKDVDAIFTSLEGLERFEKELLAIGYERFSKTEPAYKQLGASCILRHPDKAGFDLFHIKVCRMLALSDGMAARAGKYADFGNLSVYLLSNEDIALFKGITERPRDIDDIAVLIKEGQKAGKFDWNVIKEECETQAEHLKIEGHLFNRLWELFEKYQIRAPILSWLKHRDIRHLLRDVYEIRLQKGFTHEQILAQFKKDGFSRKEIAILDGFSKKMKPE